MEILEDKMANKEYNGEFTEIQRLKYENKKLRKQIGKLRKVISRVDFEHYQHVQELLEAQEREDIEFTKKSKQDILREKWKCWDCNKGILKLIVIFKIGIPYYFRKCNNCNKKTKMQKYNEDVEGIR